jgi:hypothetical protein
MQTGTKQQPQIGLLFFLLSEMMKFLREKGSENEASDGACNLPVARLFCIFFQKEVK